MRQAGFASPRPAYCRAMARILLLVIAAVVVLLILWMLFSGIVHLLVFGFWVVVVALVVMGVLRVARWSRSR